MAIDLGDLRVLVATAGSGSLSAAARTLRLSQPSLSARLARLERTVGRPLLLRSNRGVTLTPAGERFLQYAQRCLALAEHAVDVARTEDTKASAHITTYSGYSTIAVPFVVSVLRPLQIAVTIDDQHSEEALPRIAVGLTDLAFTLPAPHAHEVRMVPFHRDPVIAVCPPDHPLAGRRVRLRALKGAHVAYNAWGSGYVAFQDALDDMGSPRHHHLPVAPAASVAQLVKAGYAVGLVTHSTIEDDLRAVTLAQFTITDLPPWHLDIMLAHHRARSEEPAVRAVLSAVAVKYRDPQRPIQRDQTDRTSGTGQPPQHPRNAKRETR